MPSRCNCCSKEGATNKCGGCHRVFYCNKNCQRNDWKLGHKHICKKWKKELKQWSEPHAKILPMQHHRPLQCVNHCIYSNINRKKIIIVITLLDVFLYDSAKDTILHLAKIPKTQHEMLGTTMGPGFSVGFIDKANKLYIFGTGHQEARKKIAECSPMNVRFRPNDIFVLNLKTKQWNIMNDVLKPSTAWREGIYHPRIHFVNNVAHIIYADDIEGHHEIFDLKTNTFTELKNNAHKLQVIQRTPGNGHYPLHCCFIEPLNKFIVIIAGSSSMWSLDMNQGKHAIWAKEKHLVWPMGLMTVTEDSAVVLGFGFVIYIFAINSFCRNMEIWCYDTLSRRWYKSEKKVPKYFMENSESTTHHAYLSTSGRYAHYIGMYFHDKIDLYDLSPNELRSDINKLISGFVSKEIYPHTNLKTIILSYYFTP